MPCQHQERCSACRQIGVHVIKLQQLAFAQSAASAAFLVFTQIALTVPLIWSSNRQKRPGTKILMAWEQQLLLAANDTGAMLQPHTAKSI